MENQKTKQKKSPRKLDYKNWKERVLSTLAELEETLQKPKGRSSKNIDFQCLDGRSTLEAIDSLIDEANKWNLDSDNANLSKLVELKDKAEILAKDVQSALLGDITQKDAKTLFDRAVDCGVSIFFFFNNNQICL